MNYLILARHGESRWNTANKFTGWVDVPLAEKGIKEAAAMTKCLKHLKLDVAFTSNLERARETLLIILASQHCTGIFLHEDEHHGFKYSFNNKEHEIFVHTDWALNERHYGALQGMNKEEAAKKYGREKVLAWRRSFNERPPRGESLRDVYDRVVPYFKRKIMPEIRRKKNVLVVAHGNSLRALIKYIDDIPDEKIAHLELQPGYAYVYGFKDGTLKKTFSGHSFRRPVSWR